MKLKASCLAAALLLGLVPAVCPGQDFSADVVYLATTKPEAQSTSAVNPARPPAKLYVSKDKMRLETRGTSGTILLVNEAEHTAIALYPAQKVYQPLGRGPSQYFRGDDPENACPAWQKVADKKIVCEKVGHETVEGRETVKYRNKSASDDATSSVWIDSALKFVVKWESASAGAELHNIKEAQQAADLFVIPAGYDVLKPQKAKSKGFSQKSL